MENRRLNELVVIRCLQGGGKRLPHRNVNEDKGKKQCGGEEEPLHDAVPCEICPEMLSMRASKD